MESVDLGEDVDGKWTVFRQTCPECKKLILSLNQYRRESGVGRMPDEPPPGARPYVPRIYETWLIRPRGALRPAPPKEVPEEVARDYREACIVLPDSAKASAALSRRCLQHLLRTAAGVKPGDLASEIQQVLDGGSLPSRLAEAVDAIRNIGNFAAHPTKSTGTDSIVDVEPGEAEWNLDVLESLFDYYFVQPAILQAKKDALNRKLKDAGKPPMK
jgi:uncharacterized protein DUF4145